MTKAYFTELVNYNIWANDIVCSWLEQITDEQWEQEIVSSFNSIQGTILHIISAEHVWVQRLNKMEKTEWLASTYKGTKAEHIALWKQASADLKKLLEDFDENNLPVKFEFKRINGEVNVLEYYQAFAHIFNHSTYHRGQVLTMLRQVGFTNVGSTDLLIFYRL
jgi:uncharacterized damage-inducible protein DinB